MKEFILILVLLCAGCTPSNNLNVAKASYLCKDSGGLYLFYSFDQYPVQCKDGTKFDISTLEGTIILNHEYLPKSPKINLNNE